MENKKKIKLANFDNPKWGYVNLKHYAQKYRKELSNKKDIPEDIKNALLLYQMQSKETLIKNLKTVQSYLYK